MSELESGKPLALLTGPTAPRNRPQVYLPPEGRSRASLTQHNWQIRWSRFGIAISHSRYKSGEERPSVSYRFAGFRVFLLIAATVGIGVMSAMMSRDSGDTGRYLLSIDLPASPRARDRLPPPPARADPDKVEVMRPIATLAQSEPEQSLPADDALPGELQPEPDVPATQPTVPDQVFTAEGPAVAAALSSGQFQSWQDATPARRGFVVVGASERDGDRACRDLTILVGQDGEESDITRQRKCRDGTKGAWR